MNKKNKVLLTSVGLALLSGIAATGSTFAWFTTTRTASVSYSKATVKSGQSNLLIDYVSSLNTMTESQAGSLLTLTGGNMVTDISGNGLNFYKPVWSADPAIASSINVVDFSSSADGLFIDFTISVTIQGEASMNVYLGADTVISAFDENPESDEAVASSRMAVIVDGAAVLYYAPDLDGAAPLSAASSTPVAIASATTTALSPVPVASFTTHTSNPVDFAGRILSLVPTESVLGAGDWSATKNVTFRAWVEGQDADCDNDAIGGIFDIDIDLFALEA